MEIDVRWARHALFAEVTYKNDNVVINSGLLNEKERISLAVIFIEAARDLIDIDTPHDTLDLFNNLIDILEEVERL